jgi:hypothetical protein
MYIFKINSVEEDLAHILYTIIANFVISKSSRRTKYC